MRIFWKSLCGHCIYRSQDKLSVHQNPWYRWLIFNNQTDTLQTLIHRYEPSRPAMPYLHSMTYALRAHPGPTCLLGLGGGAMAHYISPYLSQHPLVSIEVNADVVQVARQYFMLNTIQNLKVLQQDAQEFMSVTEQLYQHILIDVFDQNGYPDQCSSIEFFQSCRHRLNTDGVLALNLPCFHHHNVIFNHVRHAFEQVTVVIPVKGCSNAIVLAMHSTQQLRHLMYTCPHLKTFFWDNIWGYYASLS